MDTPTSNRRSFVASSTSALAAAAIAPTMLSQTSRAAEVQPALRKFRYCLNMSTINSSMIPLREQLRIASEAGYDSVELWLRDVDKFIEEKGDLAGLRKEIADLGLSIDSSIAFGKWIVDNDEERTAGLEQCKKDMDNLRFLGGRRMAAPPVGATNEPKLNLDAAAQRYRTLLEIGRARDVLPQVELWGFSKNLATVAEVLHVAAGAMHPDACVLLDVYHLYKGGSDFSNLGIVPGAKMHCLHINDYPANPPRDTIGDKDRVYPGDGVAPMSYILRTLAAGGFCGTLSLELFNRDYWQLPPAEVAKTGLEKMKAVVAQAS